MNLPYLRHRLEYLQKHWYPSFSKVGKHLVHSVKAVFQLASQYLKISPPDLPFVILPESNENKTKNKIVTLLTWLIGLSITSPVFFNGYTELFRLPSYYRYACSVLYPLLVVFAPIGSKLLSPVGESRSSKARYCFALYLIAIWSLGVRQFRKSVISEPHGLSLLTLRGDWGLNLREDLKFCSTGTPL